MEQDHLETDAQEGAWVPVVDLEQVRGALVPGAVADKVVDAALVFVLLAEAGDGWEPLVISLRKTFIPTHVKT
jgi:hypothetical protein